MKKQTRSEARKETFKLVFQTEKNNDDVEFLIGQMLENKPECEQNLEYIKSTVFGILDKDEELKKDISENLSSGWRIERISKVSLALLKLAIYEIKYIDEIPTKVSINEAVELDKTFEENSAFINGVLGGFCKKNNII